MDVPVLPIDTASTHIERDTFRLCDVNWFQVRPVSAFFLNRLYVVVVGRSLVKWASHRRDIDVDDLLGLCIVDRAEV